MKDKYIINNTEEDEKKSSSSVLNLSLESTKEISKESISQDNALELKKELMCEVNLPIENELESDAEKKEKELGFNLDSNSIEEENNEEKLSIFKRKLKTRKKSKSFQNKNNINKIKRPTPKEPTEYVSPLKLNRKTFGYVPSFNKKPNEVLCDFQKNIIDSKSCNDDDGQDEFILSDSETERATPSPEDLQNLLDCRKKMTLFKNGINVRNYKEYENILNSDNIFLKNINSHNKKNNFWNRHIRRIIRGGSLQVNNSVMTRLSTGPLDYINNENKEDGLFILGILESAVNQRKGRYTTNV